MTTVESLYEQAMELSVEEREVLTARLEESLVPEPGSAYDEAWRVELDRREAEHLAGTDPDVPRDEAMNRIFGVIDHQ